MTLNKIKSVAFIALLCTIMGCGWDPVPSGTIIQTTPTDFLSGQTYTGVVVEIEYIAGYQPTSAAVTNLQNFLQSRLNKPAGITLKVNTNGIPTPSKVNYQPTDLLNIEANYRQYTISGTTLSIYIFFADADYGVGSNAKTFGIAYGISSIAVFEKTLRGYAGGVGQPSLVNLETTVLLHEAGHILGLVNNGTLMVSNHQDTVNGQHCNDNTCLMYYKVDTSDIIANLTGGNIPALNAACLSDLKSNGGQ